jgi:hypothetical protein
LVGIEGEAELPIWFALDELEPGNWPTGIRRLIDFQARCCL